MAWTLRRRRRGRQVECCWCGRTIPVAKAVIVTRPSPFEEGGTATVAEYCKPCARKVLT